MEENTLVVEKKVNYSKEETDYRNALIKRLCQMRDDRDTPHPELDDMSYVQYYESNRKKDLSYIPPKKNKQDVRIVTGTTREKDTTLLSTLLNMDLEPDVNAFDKDDLLLNELGDNMSDLVNKSRHIEDWDRKRPLIYRELISQGDVFVEERWTDKYVKIPLGELNWDPIKDGVSKLSITERLQRVDSMAEVRMVNGKKVYLGDLSVEYAQDQDDIAVVQVYPRARAESLYGQWERWKYVPKAVDEQTLPVDEGSVYYDWNMVSNDENQVVEIRYYNQRTNRFMVMLNGVMMLPTNYPLTAISPTGGHVIGQGKLEPISGFAYSKSQPSKTKVDQEVLDELTRLMIQKTRQSFTPPIGNVTKKVYSNNIFLPGMMTNNVRKEQLFPLIETRGVSASEFNFYNVIRESINEKTTNDVFGGNDPQGDPTATEINQQQQQQMLKLGSALDGVVNMERQLTWNRIQNILRNWTKEQDKNADDIRDLTYNNISIPTALSDGQNGIKMIRFTNNDFPAVADQEQEEEDLAKVYNQPVRIVYMHPRALRNFKGVWYITIVPKPKQNDKLSVLMFVQNIQQAQAIFGVESLNYEYLKQRYATLQNEDYTKMFKKMDAQEQAMAGEERKAREMQKQGYQAGTGNQGRGTQQGQPQPPSDANRKRPLKAAIT